MNTLIGKVVLFLGMLWLAFCFLATIVFVLNTPDDIPDAYAVTMFFMAIVGMIYTMVKFAKWIDWPKGSPPYLSIQIKRREDEQNE